MRYVGILLFMLMLDALLIILFIMYNFLWWNPDTGVIPMLSDMANRTITNPTFRDQVISNLVTNNEYFNWMMTTCIVLTVVVGVVGSLDKEKTE